MWIGDVTMSPSMMLIALIGAHFLADYPLQGDFLSKAKNRNSLIKGVPWYQAMVAHCFIQAAAVALITGIWWLVIVEFVIHFLTDMAKCDTLISYNVDQGIHVLCKILWWILACYCMYPAHLG